MRGLFVTLEGVEGCGKSTQIQLLLQTLRAAGHQVLALREPGGTRTGEILREILQHDRGGEPLACETEILLFAASRAHLVRSVILPALEGGTWVVCDRFMDSTVAYQGYGRGFDLELIDKVNRLAVGAAVPDLTVLLDLPVEEGARRLQQRFSRDGGVRDRIEREESAFHQRVHAGYLALAAREPGRIRRVDAGLPADAVAGQIWSLVQEKVAGASAVASGPVKGEQ